MKGCRGLIFSTLFCNISYTFAAIALHLLLFSYMKQGACRKPADATILLPYYAGPHGDGTSCNINSRDTLPPKRYYREQRNCGERGWKSRRWAVGQGRGLIAGALGSTPPKCEAKCPGCTPCKAVRVPIQPGRTKVRLMEYYPEAWRCKCKNKLYMP